MDAWDLHPECSTDCQPVMVWIVVWHKFWDGHSGNVFFACCQDLLIRLRFRNVGSFYWQCIKDLDSIWPLDLTTLRWEHFWVVHCYPACSLSTHCRSSVFKSRQPHSCVKEAAYIQDLTAPASQGFPQCISMRAENGAFSVQGPSCLLQSDVASEWTFCIMAARMLTNEKSGLWRR